MAEIAQKCDFLTWSIQNFIKKVKQFVRKYYISGLIDLANKLSDIGKFLISCYAMCYKQLFCFIQKLCKQTCCE